MHLKKNKISNTWPIRRKGTKFIAKPSHAMSKGISMLFLLRDIMGIVKTKKEAHYMAMNGLVKINNKIRRNENFPVQVFDTVHLEKANIDYRLEIINRKFRLKEISQKESEQKIVKITGKTTLPRSIVQMNLDDGQNFIYKNNFSVGDSVVINTKEDKIEKILPLKEGSSVEIISGKHAGKRGKIVKFESLAKGKNYVVELNGVKVSLPFETILVIG